jgi:hypothetical protein
MVYSLKIEWKIFEMEIVADLVFRDLRIPDSSVAMLSDGMYAIL